MKVWPRCPDSHARCTGLRLSTDRRLTATAAEAYVIEQRQADFFGDRLQPCDERRVVRWRRFTRLTMYTDESDRLSGRDIPKNRANVGTSRAAGGNLSNADNSLPPIEKDDQQALALPGTLVLQRQAPNATSAALVGHWCPPLGTLRYDPLVHLSPRPGRRTFGRERPNVSRAARFSSRMR